MNKYVKDNNIIFATEKAYNLLYKKRGYVLFVQKPKSKSTRKKEEDNNEI